MTLIGLADTIMVVTIKGHFDGKTVVLDEPASLAVGQAVRVIVDAVPVAVPTSEPDVDLEELRQKTDEALKPVREAFTASGMTDDELAEFLEIETHKMRGVPYPPQ